MNYQWHYNRLIETRRHRERIKGQYYERHHVLPRSMNGDNSEVNLVYLTAREHFIAHWLLWRIHRNKQMGSAFWCMCQFKNKQTQGKERRFSSRGYQEAREAGLLNSSSKESHEKTAAKLRGRKQTPEHTEKVRKALTGKHYQTAESKAIVSKLHKGRTLTEEHKRKISENSGSRRPEVREKLSMVVRPPVKNETREKLSAVNKGKKRTLEQCKRISESAKNRKQRKPISEETREKLSAVNKGKKRTLEQCERMSKSAKNRKRKNSLKMNLLNIESRFKEVSGLTHDFAIFPHNEIHNQVRRQENSHLGEVWTPSMLADKMLLTSNPQPDKFNLDLCAGFGIFTVRMLRKFTQDNPNFDINNYLTNYHWFNEINEESCRELLYIFGNNINLAIGPAQELKSYPEDFSGTWKRGIFKFHKGAWHEVDEHLNFKDFKEFKPTQLF